MALHRSLIALVLAASAPAAYAQVVQISGAVTLVKANGARAPVAGAQVDLFRTDIARATQVRTGPDGRYVLTGVAFVGTYAIAVSAPGAAPAYVQGVRPSQRPTVDFELRPGDGARLTLAQIQSGAAAGGGGETVEGAFKAGNEAFAARNYDAAIAAYDAGLAISEEPALLINKSSALQMRGIDRFNASLKPGADEARQAGADAAKADWAAAAVAGRRALALTDAAMASAPAGQASAYQANRRAALAAYAEAMRLVATKSDPNQAGEALRALRESADQEPDAAIRSRRRTEAVNVLLDAGQAGRAEAEVRKLLAADPRNLGARFYLGMALIASADKAKLPEAANALAEASAGLPESDPRKAKARDTLRYLRDLFEITPTVRPR